jgi:D-glycero-alpha-D-manno-heptose 1-phosphate guanylyltransferase
MELNEAIILAGGLGTRLRSAVPTFKMHGAGEWQPFSPTLSIIFKKKVFKNSFALGYKSEAFEEFLATKLTTANYQLSTEEEPRNGGAIRKACSLMEGKTAIVANGDTLFRVDLKKLIFHHMWLIAAFLKTNEEF